MGLQHIAPKIAADKHRQIQHETFGHLFPESGAVFHGVIHIALSDYGDYVILKDNSTVTSSPWWFDSLTKFTYDFLSKIDSPGVVFKIQIKCETLKSKDGEYIKITSMGQVAIEL